MASAISGVSPMRFGTVVPVVPQPESNATTRNTPTTEASFFPTALPPPQPRPPAPCRLLVHGSEASPRILSHTDLTLDCSQQGERPRLECRGLVTCRRATVDDLR